MRAALVVPGAISSTTVTWARFAHVLAYDLNVPPGSISKPPRTLNEGSNETRAGPTIRPFLSLEAATSRSVCYDDKGRLGFCGFQKQLLLSLNEALDLHFQGALKRAIADQGHF